MLGVTPGDAFALDAYASPPHIEVDTAPRVGVVTAVFGFFVVVHFFNGRESELVAIFLFAHEANGIDEVIIEIKDSLEVLCEIFICNIDSFHV